MHSRYTVGAVAAAALLLSGCDDYNPVMSERLPACDPVESTVPVEELGTEPWDACDLEGLTVEFPDGAEIEVPEAGAARGEGDANIPASWLVRNWGGYSVVAVYRTEGSLHYWGVLEGIEFARLQDAEIDEIG